MKIFCVGRNYAEHAKELGNAVPDEPIIFSKPPTAVLKDGAPFYLPDFSADVHHEAEIVLRVAKNGKHIDPKFAHKYYDHLTIGIDFTARDLQSKLKAKGQPWEIAKGFDGSAPVGQFVALSTLPPVNSIEFTLLKNGHPVQKGNTANLLFAFDVLIAYISKFFTLQQGDLIFTGTPEGVGRVQIGDHLEGFIGNHKLLDCKIM
ncbi:FAA hydrolase family protein [Sphingobacteriales bacterium UPWRP_1]|nr:2-hydroxyhepta-2,4-diene-1,7-dioate isomerase [Sphingobacteriales bacterium TSM_CSM]PSJ73546.1 FAA hydrolase family protein [Sphingobacteriales bacterium UPWRP_1]